MNLASDSCKWDLEYFYLAHYIYPDRHLSKHGSGHISYTIRYQLPLTFYHSNILSLYFAQFYTDPE